MKRIFFISMISTAVFSLSGFAETPSTLQVDCSNTNQIVFRGGLNVEKQKIQDGAGAMAYPVNGKMLALVKGKYNESLIFNLDESVLVKGFLYGELPNDFSLYLENNSHPSKWQPNEMHFSTANLETPNVGFWSAINVEVGLKEYPEHPAGFMMKLKCQYKVQK